MHEAFDKQAKTKALCMSLLNGAESMSVLAL